jgi:hypothetical protein
MNNDLNKKDLEAKLDDFLGDTKETETIVCKDDVCIIKNDKSIVERLHKTVITQDGRQLLM